MRILSENGGPWYPAAWSTKVNFVDEANVVVGYDMQQKCCEHAAWCVLDAVADAARIERIADGEHAEHELEDEADWRIDPAWFSQVGRTRKDQAGGAAVFRLLNPESGAEKFLHLINCHDGYYAHGFTVKVGGQVVLEGDL